MARVDGRNRVERWQEVGLEGGLRVGLGLGFRVRV